MHETLTLHLITPKERVFSGPVAMVVLPGQHGALGVMAYHAAMISMLVPGPVAVYQRPDDSNPHIYVAGSGYVHITDNDCTVLVASLLSAEALHRPTIAEEVSALRAELDAYGEDDMARQTLERSLQEAQARLAWAPTP